MNKVKQILLGLGLAAAGIVIISSFFSREASGDAHIIVTVIVAVGGALLIAAGVLRVVKAVEKEGEIEESTKEEEEV